MDAKGGEETWNVVLAAGAGTRMAPLTRLLYGHDVPKQYAAFDGPRTMLQKTLDRIAPLAPPERTVVVIAAEHEGVARRQLAEFAGLDIAVQPSNAGTGPGVMFPVARVLSRDPRARVLIFPADHHFGRPDALIEGARRLGAAAGSAPDGCALIGVPASRADVGLGWLLPGRRLDRGDARAIERFVEKPAAPVAEHLFRLGALWNTLVIGGSAMSLWRLAAQHIPEQTALLARYLVHVDGAQDADVLANLYQDMPPGDFSRDVLQRARGVGVVTVEDAGWSDWGTPERLMETLTGTSAGDQLMACWVGVGARMPPNAASITRRVASPFTASRNVRRSCA